MVIAARGALVVVSAVILGACNGNVAPDAYGTFESVEIVVSAQAGGQLLQFEPEEGSRLANGAVVGTIDTTQLILEKNAIVAQQEAGASRTNQVADQVASLKIQRDLAKRNLDRLQRLLAVKAATAVQVDQAESDYQVLAKQIEATQSQYRSSRQDVDATHARVAQVRERLQKSQIVNPRTGTVLATYAKTGEVVQPGQPLYKIANLDSMILRAYVTETQLASVHIGGDVQVSIDVAKGSQKVVTGRVVWVSSEAEFTPTPIQTRDERADLVYAVKISVPNEDGIAKIGMPADVQFIKSGASPSSPSSSSSKE